MQYVNRRWRCCGPRRHDIDQPVSLVARLPVLARSANGGVVRLRKLHRPAIFRPPAWGLGINPDVLVGSFQGFAQTAFTHLTSEEIFAEIIRIPAVLAPIVIEPKPEAG